MKTSTANTVTVKKIRSDAGRTKEIKNTLLALGLKKIGDTKQLPDNPCVRGMIKKVNHLVEAV